MGYESRWWLVNRSRLPMSGLERKSFSSIKQLMTAGAPGIAELALPSRHHLGFWTAMALWQERSPTFDRFHFPQNAEERRLQDLLDSASGRQRALSRFALPMCGEHAAKAERKKILSFLGASAEGYDEGVQGLAPQRVKHAAALAEIASAEEPSLASWEAPMHTVAEARGFLELLRGFPTDGATVLITETW